MERSADRGSALCHRHRGGPGRWCLGGARRQSKRQSKRHGVVSAKWSFEFVTRIKNENTIARDELPFPLHEPVKVLAEFRRDMQLVLTVDDREAARGTRMLPARPPEGLSVGFDQRRWVWVYTVMIIISRAVSPSNFASWAWAWCIAATERGTGWRLHFQHQCRRRHRTKDQHPPGHQRQSRAAYSRLSFIPDDLRATDHSRTFRRPEDLTVDWSVPGLNRQPLTALPNPRHSRHPADTAIPSAGILTWTDRSSSKLSITWTAPISSLAKPNSNAKPSAPCSCVPYPFETRELVDKPAGVLRIDGTFTEGKLLRVDKETVTPQHFVRPQNPEAGHRRRGGRGQSRRAH